MGHIDEFLAELPESDRPVVQHLYDIAKRLAPNAEDGLGYGVPAWRLNGKGLLGVKKAAKHYALIPYSADVLEIVPAPDGVAATKGTIRFQVDTPLPDELVEAVIRARIAEIEQK